MNDNKRSSRLVTYRGETKALGVWARELGFNYDTAHDRIVDRGWTVEAAFAEAATRSA